MALIQLKSNRQIDEEKQKKDEDLLEIEKPEEVTASLSGYLRKAWEEAKRDRIDTENQILINMRQIIGTYDPSKIAEIRKFGGSESYLAYTQTKWRNAHAWISDVLNDIPFDIEPTPKPTLPGNMEETIITDFVEKTIEQMLTAFTQSGVQIDSEMIARKIEESIPDIKEGAEKEVKDYAKEKAKEMKEEIHDQLTEGEWYDAIEKITPDIFMKVGILKGPIVRIEKQRKVKIDEKGIPHISYQDVKIPQYERRPPLDIYPFPGVTSFQKGGFVDRLRYTPTDIQGFIGLPGFNEDKIREVLTECRTPGSKLREWTLIDVDRAEAEKKNPTMIWDWEEVDCLEFHCPIQGRILHTYNEDLKKKASDEDKFYDVEAYLIGGHVIKAVLNPDPMGKRNYSKCSFINLPDSFWGIGIPEVIKDIQGPINACVRALCNNIAVACLTGDTMVYRGAGLNRALANITIQELWDKKNKHNGKVRHIRLRSLDERTGEFFGNKLVDIIDNGIREVYDVITEKGYHITATSNHRFMRDDGTWQELEEFDVGDLIAVNGQVVPLSKTCVDCGIETKGRGLRCVSCAMKRNHPAQGPPKICIECGAPTKRRGVRCRSCASLAQNSQWNQKQIAQARENYEINPRTARGRYECRILMKDFCEMCGVRSDDKPIPRLEIHHKDRTPWNNSQLNLQTFCSACHHALHAKEDSFGDAYLHRYLSYDTIVSIEYVGEKQVFDLQMEGPNHNFIANGLLNHNSGPQVTIDESVLSDFESGDMTPWKRWWVKYQEGISRGTIKAIEFYQPTLIAQQLIESIKFLMALGDEFTIPAYAHGNPQVGGGVGSTASGFSMFQTASSRGIKLVLKQMDKYIIEESVQRQFNWNMDRKKFSGLVGDMKIVPKGLRSLIAKEQQATRQTELYNVAAASKALTPDELRNFLRLISRTHEIDPDDFMEDQLIKDMKLPSPSGPTGASLPKGANVNEAGDKAQGKDFQTIQGRGGPAEMPPAQ